MSPGRPLADPMEKAPMTPHPTPTRTTTQVMRTSRMVMMR
jgi:hypothetical protein